MPRVKLLCGMTGGKVPGDVIEVDEGEAERLCARGFAVPAQSVRVETAAIEPRETRIKKLEPVASKRRTGKRGR